MRNSQGYENYLAFPLADRTYYGSECDECGISDDDTFAWCGNCGNCDEHCEDMEGCGEDDE